MKAAHAGLIMVAFLSAAGLAGCADTAQPAYSRFEQIGNDGWDPMRVLYFEPWPADSVIVPGCTYRLDLVLRMSVRHNINAIPMAVETEDMDGIIRTDTIVVSPDRTAGASVRSNYGMCEIILPLDSNITLTDGYAVTLSALAPAASSKGLMNVGVVLTADSHR